MDNHDLLVRLDTTVQSMNLEVLRLRESIDKLDHKLDIFREEEIKLTERFGGHVLEHEKDEKRAIRNATIAASIVSAVGAIIVAIWRALTGSG